MIAISCYDVTIIDHSARWSRQALLPVYLATLPPWCPVLKACASGLLHDNVRCNTYTAQKHAMLISRTFIPRDMGLLVRAYLPNLRYTTLEHHSVIWSPYTIKDIEAIECIQRRFTKNLPGLRSYSYPERLHLLWCCKLVFGIVDIDTTDFFTFNTSVSTWWEPIWNIQVHSLSHMGYAFTEPVVNVWSVLSKQWQL